jgi:hypothetical protein
VEIAEFDWETLKDEMLGNQSEDCRCGKPTRKKCFMTTQRKLQSRISNVLAMVFVCQVKDVTAPFHVR